MTWEIVRGDARALPLADATVDLIVCSPPYWGLRSYRDGGEHYDGQIGSEVTPAGYVAELVGMIDAEWRRVLKPSGSMFLNLGDKYAGSRGGNQSGVLAHRNPALEEIRQENAARYLGAAYPQTTEARPKSLLGLPWRIALALIDRGWILRAEIIWSKPNGLPESVTDRVRRSHEQVFHFTLEPRYYSAVDEMRDEYAPTSLARFEQGDPISQSKARRPAPEIVIPHGDTAHAGPNPLGRLPGSVWVIPTSPLIIPDTHKAHWNLPDHFAAYPPELVRRIILGWSPKGVCTRCGEGRRPVVEKTLEPIHEQVNRRFKYDDRETGEPGGVTRTVFNSYNDPEHKVVGRTAASVVGEACACPTPDAPTRPGCVLDPMAGTGTTVGVAHKLGRHGIGVDLSEDYCRLACWRIGQSGHFDMVDDRTAAEAQLTLGEA